MIRKAKVGILSRILYPYHSTILQGLVAKMDEPNPEVWRPHFLLYRRPTERIIDVFEQELMKSNIDVLISVGTGFTEMAANLIREKRLNIPLIYVGISDQKLIDLHDKKMPFTGVIQEATSPTFLPDVLPFLKPSMRKILIPYNSTRLESLAFSYRDRFKKNGIEAILLPIGHEMEYAMNVAAHAIHVDSLLHIEGCFSEKFELGMTGRMCVDNQITFISSSIGGVLRGASIEYSQNPMDLVNAILEQLAEVIDNRKQAQDVPIKYIPNRRTLTINPFTARQQNCLVKKEILYGLRNTIVI